MFYKGYTNYVFYDANIEQIFDTTKYFMNF